MIDDKLEMNEYEKMVSELIKEKKKIEMNFEKVYISLVLVFIVLFAVFGMFLFQKGKIDFEDFFLIILFGGIISFFFGICFTAIIYIFLKILKFIMQWIKCILEKLCVKKIFLFCHLILKG